MKRHAIALLLRPFKNAILPADRIKEGVDRFADSFLKVAGEFQNIHWNLVIPGYMLERMDSILLSKLREVQKRGCLEWLTCGYTEPFVSFSPEGLTQENIRAGIGVTTDLAGISPGGFVPSFSNWEPSLAPMLERLGLHYAVLSETLFPEEMRARQGYWATEHLGSALSLFPMRAMQLSELPQPFAAWLDEVMAGSGQQAGLLCVDVLLPLTPAAQPDQFAALRLTAESLENNVLRFQTVRFDEALAQNPPQGLHYPPQSLSIRNPDGETVPGFLDYLHTFDQVGILQRRMMELYEAVAAREPNRHTASLIKTLLFLQDINRYLPASDHGFLVATDRAWTYRKLIELDAEMQHVDKVSGGQIRIADHLKNRTKCVVMSNKPIKVYIDHRGGSHVFELDFRYRHINICAACAPGRYEIPRILMPGRTESAFVDHLLAGDMTMEKFASGEYAELGDFCGAPFDYTVKKTSSSVRCLLVRNGSLALGDKPLPLTMEKVFGLEGDQAALSFVYKFSSHSLVACSFKVALEIPLFLPGATSGDAHFSQGRSGIADLMKESVAFEGVTKWTAGDHARGVHLVFSTQRPVDVWCYPVCPDEPYQGTMLVVSSHVQLDEKEPWTLMGRIEFKRTKMKEKSGDAC